MSKWRQRRLPAPWCARRACAARRCRDLTGADVWLKFENLQFTAAYKERGALNKLLSLTPEERQRGVIAASAGNHAQGLAYGAKRLGIPATIVMPKFTPVVKVQQTEGHGANVVLFGEKFEEAAAHAHELAAKRGFVFVHPFDDPMVMAGQGTVGLEMLDDVPDLETLVVPIGGGGLISGIATVAKARNPNIEVIGVQAELYPSMYAFLKGETSVCDGDTLAEGIAVKTPGKLTSQVVRALVDDIVLVGERDLERGVAMLLNIEKTVVEGAGAAGLAALLAHPRRFRGTKVGLVLCGGNIDTRLLANVLLRELARSGRLARLRIRLKDRPGPIVRSGADFRSAAGQHPRSLSPARVHQPAGQGPDRRNRMRDPRRRSSRSGCSKPCAPPRYEVRMVEAD